MIATHIKPSDFVRSAHLTSDQLYDWQKDIIDAVAAGFPTALIAPNGSGKSSRAVTYLILWFLSEHTRGRCIVTSGSWSQLQNQIFASLKRFEGHHLFKNWEFLDSSVKNNKGGFCEAISTDDSRRAVGYHQDENSPVLLIVDEASAVSDSIFEAFSKCSPTFQLVTGTAGTASGRFYRLFTSEKDYWFRRKITYHDCPHLSDAKRLADQEIYGENSVFFKNRWLSEFASDNGENIISLDSIRECVAHPPPWEQSGFVTAGADFAGSGADLCCLALARGNKIELDQHNWTWHAANTNHSAGRFVTLFRELNLESHQIFADVDGLGKGFVDNLQECGYFVREMRNGAPAHDPDRYANINAEQWDQLATLITKRRIILPNCEELFSQLSNRQRQYSISAGKLRIKLESKQSMKARNVHSPDLADAVVLALMNGWGGLPQNLNPSGNRQLLADIAQSTNALRRQRSEFYTDYVDFSRL